MTQTAFIEFLLKPKNELEYGGRKAALQPESGESVRTCPNCRREIALSLLAENAQVCSCGWHFRMSARERLGLVCDEGSFRELFPGLTGGDPIAFPGYGEKLAAAQKKSGESEGVVCGRARLGGAECCVFAMEPGFMMASMGCAVGEKITRLFEAAEENALPVVGFTVSGGARMQEGILSLMQMAKTSAAVKRHSERGLFYCAVLTDPTTGGVTASFAMLADVTLAEPGATVGFAGARVIEQTTRKKLPDGFQTSEFLLSHGFVDAIVDRRELRQTLTALLELHSPEGRQAT